MAGNLLISSEEKLLPKSVQELSMDGDEPPSKYLVKGSSFGSKISSTPIPIPIIDVSLLSSEEELEKLRSALSSAGCFQVRINLFINYNSFLSVQQVPYVYFGKKKYHIEVI